MTGTLDTTKALSQFLDERVGSERSLDFKPLIGSLYTLSQIVTRAAAAAAGSDGASMEGGAVPGSAEGGGAMNTSGAIRSRRDVVLLLDKICEFLDRTEPSNPAPLLLQRAKRLMEMNFIDLLKELAPDGLPQARNVTGVRDEE